MKRTSVKLGMVVALLAAISLANCDLLLSGMGGTEIVADNVSELKSEFTGMTNLQTKSVDYSIDVYTTWVVGEFAYMQEDVNGGPGIISFDTGIEDSYTRGDRLLVHVTNIQLYWDNKTIYLCEVISNVSSGNTITPVDVLASRSLSKSDEAVWVKLDGTVQTKDSSSISGVYLVTVANGSYTGKVSVSQTMFNSITVGDSIVAQGPVYIYDAAADQFYVDMNTDDNYISVN